VTFRDAAAASDTYTRDQRIEQATTRDAGNRSRYHGQCRRGRIATAQLDELDVRFAIIELERAREAFAAAQALPVGSRERAHAEREAAHHVAFASRFTDELLDRRRM